MTNVAEEKLVQRCEPNQKVDFFEEHKHLCSCGVCWKHDNEGPHNYVSKLFHLAHTCPSCGNKVQEKHDFDEFMKELGLA